MNTVGTADFLLIFANILRFPTIFRAMPTISNHFSCDARWRGGFQGRPLAVTIFDNFRSCFKVFLLIGSLFSSSIYHGLNLDPQDLIFQISKAR
jgi:hypothetical protein